MRKINTIGIKQANKVMHLSNLKKYLKFTQKRVKSGTGMQAFTTFFKKRLHQVFILDIRLLKYKKRPATFQLKTTLEGRFLSVILIN